MPDAEPVEMPTAAIPPVDGDAAANSTWTAPDIAMVADSPLIQSALAALQAGAAVVLDEQTLLVEERNIWQPESWLLQRCWETLADAGYGVEALMVANHLVARRPLARLQATYRLACQLPRLPALAPLIQHELQQWQYRLFHTHPTEAQDIERLLLVATSAALADEIALAAACLERLDNLAKGWHRVMTRPELRDQLALAIVHIGPHPLTNDLINVAIRRFDDAGAQLLYTITTLLQDEIAGATPASATNNLEHNPRSSDGRTAQTKAERLMRYCLDTLRLSTLVSLQSRRVAAMIFGQAGEVDEVLTQIATIESVQTAQRETGYAPAKEDTTLLRQVKRTSANSDVDFLVYTLRNAIDAMPLRQLRREERIALADQLALLGVRSDGWTAASATGVLVELGALHYAVQVVEQIAPQDPSRSEALIILVRSLLALEEDELAAEQAQRALDWAESLPMRNPERALTWGLAELYLQHNQPTLALQLLDRWREPTGWRQRLRNLWGETVDDDGLRNRRLRLQALLQLKNHHSAPTTVGRVNADPANESVAATPAGSAATVAPPTNPTQEIPSLIRTLRRAAPRLLEGEALVHFYVDGLLQPLFRAQREEQAWELLPDLQIALLTLSGSKHADRVAAVAELLRDVLQRRPNERGNSGVPSHPVRNVIDAFLRDLWRESAKRGLWQVVHSIEGTLALLLQVEGPGGILAIVQAVNTHMQDGADSG